MEARLKSLAATAAALDAADPLAHFRDEFQLRESLIYLNGNSLGALPKETAASMAKVVESEWGEGLISSWNEADWVNAPLRIGDKIASIIGADEGEVIVADSTSINIFKALGAALSLQKGRSLILTEEGNFPTDHYMMQGYQKLTGGRVKAKAVPGEDVLEHLDENVAALLLTHVHYKTGRMRDMSAVNRAAHEKGVFVIWDLSHSAGAVELDLNGADADFAIGCGYKFLNGGPGAPAYIYAAKRHQHADAVLTGWFGHARPFAFEEQYDAAGGIERFLCGTPSILGMASLEIGVDLLRKADLRQIREKSLKLGELLSEAMKPLCEANGFVPVSPALSCETGSQLSYAHPHAYAVVQALKARDVIGDFREHDILRFGLTPLYLRHVDMIEAAKRIFEICEMNAWDKAEYHIRAAVT